MAFNPSDHLIKLKSKDYLEVKWRLVWFREDHPEYLLDTEMVSHDEQKCHAIFKAMIRDKEGNQVSSGYGSESAKDFRDYIEKAETKAVGRALAMLGYGTQFAPELEEGERIVDAPVEQKKAQTSAKAKPAATATAVTKEEGQTLPVCEDCGEVVTKAVVTFCEHNFDGHVYCHKCQKMRKEAANA